MLIVLQGVCTGEGLYYASRRKAVHSILTGRLRQERLNPGLRLPNEEYRSVISNKMLNSQFLFSFRKSKLPIQR